MEMDWRQWLYAAFVFTMLISMLGFAAYLWADKGRAQRIEADGMIPLQDEPVHLLVKTSES